MSEELERTAIGYVAAVGRNDDVAVNELLVGGERPVDVYDLLDEVAMLAWELAVMVGERSDPPRSADDVLQLFGIGRASEAD